MANYHPWCSSPVPKNSHDRTDSHGFIGTGRRLLYAAIPVESMLILLDVLLSVISSVLYALLAGFLTPLSLSEWGQLLTPIYDVIKIATIATCDVIKIATMATCNVIKIATMVTYDVIRDAIPSTWQHGAESDKIFWIIDSAAHVGYAIPSREKMRDGFCFVSKCTSTRTVAASIQSPQVWFYDTASSYSMTGNRHLLQGIHAAQHVTISSVSGHMMSSYQCGRISGAVNLSGVRYFPGAPNLISAGHLRRLGCAATIDELGCTITNRDGVVIGKGVLLENDMTTIYVLGGSSLGSLCPDCPGQS